MWGREFKARMLMEKFGVSRPQVGYDLKQYMALFPKNVDKYNPSVKAYTPSTEFRPELNALSDDSNVEGSCLAKVPRVEKATSNAVLSLLLLAIQKEKGAELVYGSSSVPIGKKRLIYPTRIVSTANRLHFRGYCTLRKGYRDFLISRCLTKPMLKSRKIELPYDALWYEHIDVKLIVNPSLPEDGKDLVAYEYKEKLDQVTPMPKAMLHYFLIDNNIPNSDEQLEMARVNPWSYPVVVEMSNDVSTLLFKK